MSKSAQTSVTADAKLFHAALARATSGIARVKTYPILLCVLVTASEGEMTLCVTDLNCVITVRLPAEGECPPTCVDYGRLLGVLATIRDRGEVVLEVGKDGATLKCGRSRFTLGTMSAEAWPELDEPSWAHSFEVDGPKFARLMTALQPAISKETTRHYLNGIFLKPGSVPDDKRQGCLLAVATDGHKMYARHIEAPGIPATMPGIILPREACAGIAKLFGETQTFAISCSDRKLRVSVDGTDYVTRLVEGTYPDWRRVMPSWESAISYDAASLTSAAEVVAAAKTAEKLGKAIKLIFGEAETELQATDFNNPAYSGSDVVRHSQLSPPLLPEIGINVDYLIEMLASLDAETVEIAPPKSIEGGAISLRGATFDDRAIAIMPQRI